MSTLWGANIKHLLLISDVKATRFAEAIGVSKATVSDWSSGTIKHIDGENLLKVAEFFGVTARDLMYEDLSNRAKEDLAGYHQVVRALRSIPIVGKAQMGPDGYWIDLDYPVGHGDGRVLYPSSDRGAFALQVEGDSMRPRFKPKEIVIVEPSKTVESGHEVVARTTDGRVMVKVFDWRRDGIVQLSSVNEAHRPITIDEKDLMLLYRVVGCVQPDQRRE